MPKKENHFQCEEEIPNFTGSGKIKRKHAFKSNSGPKKKTKATKRNLNILFSS